MRVKYVKISLINIVLWIMGAMCYAETEVRTYTSVHTNFIGRGMDFGGGDPVLDCGTYFSLTDKLGLDWYAGVHYVRATGVIDNEVDFFSGMQKDLKICKLDVSYYSFYTPQNDIPEDELRLKLSSGFEGLDYGLQTTFGFRALSDVVWLEANLGYTLDLFTLPMSFETKTGYQAGASGINALAYTSYNISSEYFLTEKLSVAPYISYIQTTEKRAARANHASGFVNGAGLTGGISLQYSY